MVGAATEGMCTLVNCVEGPLRLPLLTVMVTVEFLSNVDLLMKGTKLFKLTKRKPKVMASNAGYLQAFVTRQGSECATLSFCFRAAILIMLPKAAN